jgi:acetyltransferase-like isoleucine patch superfamily enzyme
MEDIQNPKSKVQITQPKSARLSNFGKFTVKGEGNRIEMGENSRLGPLRIEFLGNNNTLLIAENVIYKAGQVRIVGHNQIIQIGRGTTIERCYLLCQENCKIEIGADCMFSYDITLRTTDAHSILDLHTRKRINPGASISIGNHVWVGQGVLISKGVTIQEDCIIGTRSFVNRSIAQSHCIIAGTPAKVVKQEVTWDRKRL